MSRNQYEDVLRQVEENHARYVQSLRSLLEGHAGHHSESPDRAPDDKGAGVATPPLRPVQVSPTFANDLASFPAGNPRRIRRLTNELNERRPSILRNVAPSLQSVDIEFSDEEDLYHSPLSPAGASKASEEKIFVQQPLSGYSYSDNDLLEHLQNAKFCDATKKALDDVYQKRGDLDKGNLFQVFNERHDQLYDSATYEAYEIGKDGFAEPKHAPDDNVAEDILDAERVWATIKHSNDQGTAVGRMTSLLDPSPLMLAGIHLTMSKHFDMDELFSHLVTTDGNKGKTKAYMDRAYEPTELRQRSFFFVFKYYTVVGEKFTPSPWQQYDHRPADTRSPDHIDISECSSILALSLTGKPVKTIERKKRKAKELGYVYDTFSPWQLLNIQCFPDDEHVMRNEESRRDFCNGPFAFLDSLAMEYRDAVKRNMALNDLITKLITPPIKFMFDVKLRDKLLFEDKHFTYSRRYFWAYNTLGVINDGIKSMIAAYSNTFTREFWLGRHPTLFPFPDPKTPEFILYLEKLRPLQRDIEDAVALLHQVYTKNESTRQEIKSLRDQLFSGSSVKESRRAIEQGDNIKILTSVSMIFLPLTFVTSVWSMTGFPLDVEGWQFPVTMIFACVPFILFVCMLQTSAGMAIFKRLLEWVDESVRRLGIRMNKKQPLLPVFSAHGGEKMPENNAAPAPADSRPPPRRKRRFSRSGAKGKNGFETTQNPKKGWLGWLRTAEKDDSLV